MTFRTTFRDTLSSRQIALIDLPCTKNARRILAIVSTISIPISAPMIMEASVDPQPRGPDWMPITPKRGPYSTPKHTKREYGVDIDEKGTLQQAIDRLIRRTGAWGKVW